MSFVKMEYLPDLSLLSDIQSLLPKADYAHSPLPRPQKPNSFHRFLQNNHPRILDQTESCPQLSLSCIFFGHLCRPSFLSESCPQQKLPALSSSTAPPFLPVGQIQLYCENRLTLVLRHFYLSRPDLLRWKKM